MWATVAAWAAGLFGTTGLGFGIRTLLKRRGSAREVTRLPIVRAWWRLRCLGVYWKIEDKFLARYPNQADVARRNRRLFEKQIGLPNQRNITKVSSGTPHDEQGQA